MAPYDEETIVKLVTELYQLLITLCVIDEEQVLFPPAEGHRINVELCRSLSIDNAVISLMKRIPYPKELQTQLYFCPFPRGYPYVYTYDEDISNGRDPENSPTGGIEPLRLDFVLPHDIAFTFPSSRDGSSVILDTKDNKIRVFTPMDGPPGEEAEDLEDYQRERPDDPSHYRNFIPHDAPTFLQELINRVKRLEAIPCGVYPDYGFFEKETDPNIGRMKIVIESYGWPDHFRREEWKSDMQRHWTDAINNDIATPE